MKKKSKITERDRKVAAEVLNSFYPCRNVRDFFKTISLVAKEYSLLSDPFTSLYCSPGEFVKNALEYDRQVMISRYGHCDGLD